MPALADTTHANGERTPPTRPVFHSLSACAGCGVSGDDFASPSIEAYEVTGELYCDDCADTAIGEAAEREAEAA